MRMPNPEVERQIALDNAHALAVDLVRARRYYWAIRATRALQQHEDGQLTDAALIQEIDQIEHEFDRYLDALAPIERRRWVSARA